MTHSKAIASLIGPTLIAIAAAMLLNLDSISAIAQEIPHEVALIMTSGILLFVAGLAIIRVHNRWSGGWPVLVTIFGWLFLLGGLARMLLPFRLASVATPVLQNANVVGGVAIVLLLAGVFLSYKAYTRD